jgi:hypothetical protein
MASYGVEDARPPDSAGYPGYSQAAEPESPPDPWYRNRWLLAAWATMVAILIGLIIYGLIQLSHGGGGGSSTTTPSTTPNRSSTPTRSSTSTTPPSTTTTPPEPSSTTEEQEPSDDNSPPAGEPPAPEEPPRHHHHLPHIPSTITLPHTVITLPPGL